MKPLHLALLCSVLAACGGPTSKNNGSTNNGASNNATNNGTTPNNGTTTGTNNGTGGNQSPLGLALAVSADFATGESAFHELRFGPGPDEASTVDTSFGSGDVAVSVGDGYAFVLDRNGGQIQVFDRLDLSDLGVFEIGTGTNPQFATDAADKAFVTLYNTGQIAVASRDLTADGWEVELIDLAAYDETDGNPEPSAIRIDDGDGYVLVVLQTLTDFAGVQNSQLLPIEASTLAVGQPIDLGVKNAQGGFERSPEGDLTVGYTGDYGIPDGGILRLRKNGPGDFQPDGDIVTEEQLGGDLLDYALTDRHSGYAVISKEDFSTALVLFAEASEGDVFLQQLPVESPGYSGLDTTAVALAVGARGTDFTGFSVLVGDAEEPAETIELPTALPPAGFEFLN